MFAVCFVAPGVVAWSECADPQIEAPTDALGEVELAGLCGSDLHPFFGREVGLDAGTAMGHEFVGRVVAVGAAVRSVHVSDRVCAPFSTSCGTCAAIHSSRGSSFSAAWESGPLGGGDAGRTRKTDGVALDPEKLFSAGSGNFSR